MTNEIENPRRRGRPRTTPGGRSSAITITLKPEVRARLEAAASSEGRSLSQTAERLMTAALDGEAKEQDRLGGLHAVSCVLQIAKAARTIEQHIGDPLNSDAGRRLFIDVVVGIMEALPVVAPTTEEFDYAMARNSDHPNQAKIARTKAAVDKYEAGLKRKADTLRELLKIPPRNWREREAEKQSSFAQFVREHGPITTESELFSEFVRKHGGSVNIGGVTFTAHSNEPEQ